MHIKACSEVVTEMPTNVCTEAYMLIKAGTEVVTELTIKASSEVVTWYRIAY